jgi:PEP-CTERM motif
MKFRSLLIIGASVLISAMPALANRIQYPAPEKESSGVHFGSLTGFASYEHPLFVIHTERFWDKEGEGNKDSGIDENVGKSSLLLAVTPAVAPVPEPGSISLLFVGLAAIGLLALRLRKLTSTTQVIA